MLYDRIPVTRVQRPQFCSKHRVNNWDLKVDNNKVVRPAKKSGEDTDERIYYVGDLGATFGKTGSLAHELHLPGDPPAGSKGKPGQYAHQPFIDGVRDGTVRFHYKGKDPTALKGIRVENAKWMGDMLARLSEKQLTDAFRAGGYSDSEISTLSRAIQERIRALKNPPLSTLATHFDPVSLNLAFNRDSFRSQRHPIFPDCLNLTD